MAIIVKKSTKVGAQDAPTPRSKSQTAIIREKMVVEPEVIKQDLSRNFVIEKKSVKGVASEDTTLVVNGKQKSIGRKSHYLLDMLTLDD